jgi:curved DNA-binding protein CbpA
MPELLDDKLITAPFGSSGPFAFYSVFGVARDATVDAIREEYKKLALLYHPDKHDASERVIWTSQIQILNTMRDTLVNKEERHKYNRQSRIAARDALRDVGRASLPPQHRERARYNAREHSATKAVIDRHLETIARLFREGKALQEDVANMQSFVDVYDKLPPRPDGLQEGEHWDSIVDPLVPLGQPVGKRFGGIDYAGNIVGYESLRHRSGHYLVRYQDEDLISFPARELNVYLNYYVHMQIESCCTSSSARSSSRFRKCFIFGFQSRSQYLRGYGAQGRRLRIPGAIISGSTPLLTP